MYMQELKKNLRNRGLAPAEAEGDRPSEHADVGEFEKPLQTRPKLPWSALLDDGLAILPHVAALAALASKCWISAILAGVVGLACLKRVLPPHRRRLGLKIVCISDTHGKHRDLKLPAGDILIHAGDFTKFSDRADAEDFNVWLGEQPFTTKVVVNGNHEHNADWQKQVESILSNATFLKNSGCTVDGLSIYGCDFCWPMKTESPYYALIPSSTDIVIAHGPVKGYVDGGHGCLALLWAMARVRPRLVVSGHIHGAHGVIEGAGTFRGTTFINAANCFEGYNVGWEAVSVTI